MTEERNPKAWNLEVQAWHVLLMLATQLIFLGVAYGRIVTNQERTDGEVQRIENQRTITKDEFDEWKVS